MEGLLHYLSFKIISLFAKLDKPAQEDWRRIKIDHTVHPDNRMTITEWGNHILKSNKN